MATSAVVPLAISSRAPGSKSVLHHAFSSDFTYAGVSGMRRGITPVASKKAAMMAGGGVLAALSGNVLAEGYVDQGYCDSFGCSGPYEFTDTNGGVLYGGLGVAGTGAVLALMNRGRQRQAITTFLPTRGGAAVFRKLTF